MLDREQLKDRAFRCYSRYGGELDAIRELAHIKLSQVAFAYCLANELPKEAIFVKSRVKSLSSFLRKLEASDWPQFYYPTDIAKDIIGLRVICWFSSDCYQLLEILKSTNQFHVSQEHKLRDYNETPKEAGYRGIHLYAEVDYDRVVRENDQVKLRPATYLCELQIRTKLQDGWADVTHDFVYKAQLDGIKNEEYETFIADISERLALEDKTFAKLRKFYQGLADEKTKLGKREGLSDG
jgi:putative GTP pyrophosphokinase